MKKPLSNLVAKWGWLGQQNNLRRWTKLLKNAMNCVLKIVGITLLWRLFVK